MCFHGCCPFWHFFTPSEVYACGRLLLRGLDCGCLAVLAAFVADVGAIKSVGQTDGRILPPRPFGNSPAPAVPEGPNDNSPTLQRWVPAQGGTRPVGTVEPGRAPQPSLRDGASYQAQTQC